MLRTLKVNIMMWWNLLDLSFLAEIDLCVAAGLKGKMLIKCLEKSIEAKTFVEYSSKLNLL